MATITVTNTNDSGPGSLRRALERAEENPGRDDIVFANAIKDQVIEIRSGLTIGSGVITITGDQDGDGEIDATIAFRPGEEDLATAAGSTLTIANGADVTITGVRFQDGVSTSNAGAAITNSGLLTLQDVEIASQTATGDADGLETAATVVNASTGVMSLTDVLFENVSATGSSALTLAVDGSDGVAGIRNTGDVTLTRVGFGGDATGGDGYNVDNTGTPLTAEGYAGGDAIIGVTGGVIRADTIAFAPDLTLTPGHGGFGQGEAPGPDGAEVIADPTNASAISGTSAGEALDFSLESGVTALAFAGADTITGSRGRDQLFGQTGDDIIMGRGGRDTLSGGQGDNVIDGGGGQDLLILQGEAASFEISTSGDQIILENEIERSVITRVELFQFDDQTLTRNETITFVPPPPVPTIPATDEADGIFGTDGADVVNGLGGADTIVGLRGSDILNGNGGRDIIIGNGGGDLIDGGGGRDELEGGGGRDTIDGGGGRDVVEGSGGRDELDGGGGRDLVVGGGGADLIIGGKGADTLTGGGGRDVFEFSTGDFRDQITDFRQDEDAIAIGSGAESFEDLTIEQDDEDVLIQFSNVIITVQSADADEFTRDDFLF